MNCDMEIWIIAPRKRDSSWHDLILGKQFLNGRNSELRYVIWRFEYCKGEIGIGRKRVTYKSTRLI